MGEEILSLQNLTLSFNDKDLFHIKKLTVSHGDRIGIIGDNGSGKSSLLKLITGEIAPSSGRIKTKTQFKHFKQIDEANDDAQNELDYELLSYLKVPLVDVQALSGGEKQKYRLSYFISGNQEPLLLDEPTNHLDQEGIKFITERLLSYPNTILMVSHNRDILNRLVNKIWLIENGEISEYIGNYDEFMAQRTIEQITNKNDYDKYLQTKKQLEMAKNNKLEEAKRMSTISKSQKNKRISPGRLSATKDKKTAQKGIERAAKNIENKISSLEEVRLIEKKPPLVFPLENFVALNNKIPIIASDIHIVTNNGLVLVDKSSLQFGRAEKVAILGPNGSGKTSLINYILSEEEGVFVSSKAQISLYRQLEYTELIDANPVQYISDMSDYSKDFIITVLTKLGLEGASLRTNMKDLSGGERTKVALAKTFLVPSNIVILDEPTNFLDLNTIKALENVIVEYPGMVIFTSHDEEFVKHTATSIYEIRDKRLRHKDV